MLNSLLWFQAKDEAGDHTQWRALREAVARLGIEPVDELTVLSTRYRIVRTEDYAAVDVHGDVEVPRATDLEPLVADWSRGGRDARVDDGLVLDLDAPASPPWRQSAWPCAPWPTPTPGSQPTCCAIPTGSGGL